MRHTVSPAARSAFSAAAASLALTTAVMPMPQLKTRNISLSATLPCCLSHWKSGGRGHCLRSMRAVSPSDSMRGTLPVNPPPVMWARPLTFTRFISFSIGFT